MGPDGGGGFDGFWRHVVVCTALAILHDGSHVALDGRGDAKVNELQAAVDQEKVGRFQIGMDHVYRLFVDQYVSFTKKGRLVNTFVVDLSDGLQHLLPVEPDERRIDGVQTCSRTNDGGKVRVALFHNQKELLFFLVVLAVRKTNN